MRTRTIFALLMALLWCAGAAYAQQGPPLGLTLVSDYTVKPGKEDDFMNLVKTVGAPVRDKLLAEGLILAWGVDVPVMRAPGQATHSVWVSVADWADIQRYQAAFRAQLATLAEEDKKAAEEGRKKGGKASKATRERIEEVVDASKTRNWVFRDIEAFYSKTPPLADAKPFSWFGLDRVHPGKGREYRELLDKYDKPVLDKLLADGVIGAYGLGVQEVTQTNEFTHFFWVSVADSPPSPRLTQRLKPTATSARRRSAR